MAFPSFWFSFKISYTHIRSYTHTCVHTAIYKHKLIYARIHKHAQNTLAYTLYIMLSYNCAQTSDVISRCIYKCACTRYHTHTLTLLIHSYMRSCTRTNMYMLYIIVMETQFDLFHRFGFHSTLCPLVLSP